MKRINQTILLAAVMLTAVWSSAAQEDFLDGVANKIYNKVSNETSLEVRQLEIVRTDDRWVFLNAVTSHAGKKLPKRPDDVLFFIQIGSSSGYKLTEQVQAKLKLDGIAQPDIAMVTSGKRKAGSMFLETTETRLNIEVFKKLAAAKSAEFTLDSIVFTLNSAQLKRLADLDKLMTP